MANFTQAFGYETYIVPVLATSVVIALPDTGIAKEGAPFINDTTVFPVNEIVSEAAGPPYALTVAAGVIALDGTANPISVKGLKTCSLKTDTQTEEVQTYDSENLGFSQGVATGKSWSFDMTGVSAFTDTGYKVMRLLEKGAVNYGLMAKIARRGPVGSVETVYGYGRFASFSEGNDAGGVVEWSCTFEGYAGYGINLAPPAA